MKFLGFAVLICLTQTFEYSFACGGYDVQLLSFESGKNNPTLAVELGPKILLNSKCELLVAGCLNVKKPIRSASLSFKVRKDGKLDLLEGKDVDVCEILKDSKYPNRCPVTKPERICDAKLHPIDLEKYKKYLEKVVGTVSVDAEVITNGNKNEINKFSLKLKISKIK